MKKKAKKSKGKKKTAVRKKAKKTIRKKVSRKTPKKTARKKVTKKSKAGVPAKKKVPKIQGTLIGHVTHYFPHVNAAVVKIKKGGLVIGDNLLFKGHTTDFKQPVSSMQIDRAPIEKAKAGDEIGIEVKDRVREGDSVYRL